MPIPPTYPGVYVEEVPSGVRTITGVATSIAAFVGYFTRGPMEEAVQIFSMGDFEREFGGLNSLSEASYAIQQFFLNGGSEAWVVRTASGDVASSSVTILDEDGTSALVIEAKQPGTWGDALRINIDSPVSGSGDRFTMTVLLTNIVNGQEVIAQSEVFNGLTMATVMDVVNDEFSGSKLVRIVEAGSNRPLQTGTLSGLLSPPFTLTNLNRQLTVTIGIGEESEEGIARLSENPTSLSEARTFLERAIRTARPDLRAFSRATVSIEGDRLRILAGPTNAGNRIVFSAVFDSTAETLGLLEGEMRNGVLSDNLASAGWPIAGGDLLITVGDSENVPLTLGEMSGLEAARSQLESQIRAAATTPEFENALVVAYPSSDASEGRLIVLIGTAGADISFSSTDDLADNLGLGGTEESISAFVSEEIASTPSLSVGSAVNMAFAGGSEELVQLESNATTLPEIATALEAAIRNVDAGSSFTDARVAAYQTNDSEQLIILSGTAGDSVAVTAPPIDESTVNELGLDAAEANVQLYALGGGTVSDTAQGAGGVGADGDPPNADALISGMDALQTVDLFNILCVPRAAIISGEGNLLSPEEAFAVLSWAKDVCEDRRAFLIVDTPTGVDDVQEIKGWLDANNNLRSDHAALYFPRVQIPDPLNDFKLRSVGASGTIAGLYARTDSDRGVWKAPAGTEATLTNVFRLERTLTDPENGTLNKIGINCLRTFPIYGTICWGARTLDGADETGSEYKYVPVRRLALFIEETLFRSLKWVVFEPNDEPLWAQIRLNVGAFMNNLFRQGAFQGQTPRQAYLVKCDKETTTQNDIDRGIVNIVVGFAPLKPAEFVYIKLQQLAGQIST